ncbi:MAG TPA: hypothetical protein VGG72_19590 [Bryobacteraceae bacterium]|jgi:hypothetical protein
MLSSLLDTIKGQFGSKSYWLGCMLPLILFLAANAWVAYPHCKWIATLIPQVDAWDQKALEYSALLALLLAVAYVLSTTTAAQLSMLEGKIGPLRWCARFLTAEHSRSLRKLDRAFQKAQANLKRLQGTDDEKGLSYRWLDLLERSRIAGQTAPALSPIDAANWTQSSEGKLLSDIRTRQDRGSTIDPESLQKAVSQFSVTLATYRCGDTGTLSEALQSLQSAIQYAMDRYKFDVRRLARLRQTNFPGVRPNSPDPPEGGVSVNTLAPTTMGNIGRAMAVYSLVRYQMDLEIFWTRLQSSLQKDSKDYYAVLQDSKVQVDCMLMMFWFSLVFTLYWTGALVFWFTDGSLAEFLTIAVSGTAATLAFYTLACEAYRIFGDVMRASVDLMRFQLLQALHIPLPVGTEEEKELWFRLGIATGFMDPEAFRYKHPAA